MALKDWIVEKRRYGSINYVKKSWKAKGYPAKTKDAIRILISPFEYSPTNKWQVIISEYYRNKLDTKFFKTKEKALAYTKAYMRKH